MGEISHHLKIHNKLGTPETDENGNLLAHVTPRADTLANLAVVTDAGDGEVATATDEDALAVYLGDPSEPHFFYRGSEVGYVNCTIADTTAIIASTKTQIAIKQGIVDYQGLVDAANNEVDVPLIYDHLDAAAPLLLDFNFTGVIFGGDATHFTFYIDSWNGATWASRWTATTDRQVHGIGYSLSAIGVFLTAVIAGEPLRLAITPEGGTVNDAIYSGQFTMVFKSPNPRGRLVLP